MPETELVSAYLDANVLFSASYKRINYFLEIWVMFRVIPVTSRFAIGEVRKHLVNAEHTRRFERLLDWTTLVQDPIDDLTPAHLPLVTKDRPILSAAIGSRCHYLLTGDANHFGFLYGQNIEGVSVMPPHDFRRMFKARIDFEMLAYSFSAANGW